MEEFDYNSARVRDYGIWIDPDSDHPSDKARELYDNYKILTISANSMDYHMIEFLKGRCQPQDMSIRRCEFGITRGDLQTLLALCNRASPIGILHCNARAAFLNLHPYAVPLQRPTPFDWTWLEPSDLNTRDGILAINRNWLRNYFNQQLRDYIPNVCFQVDAHCDADMFSCQMSANCSPGQQPNLSQVSGATVLSYDYTSSSSDEAGVNGDLGSLAISTTYNMVIQFTTLNGNPSIVITQNLLISCNMRRDFTQTESNLVNETIVDTYTLSVDNDGTLGASLTTNSIDNSTNNFTNSSEPFTNLGDMVNNIRNLGRALTSTNVHNIPFSDIHKYVFPGGQKFAFKDVQFSENQDLVASITYLDPSAPPPTVHSNSTG
ncbi:hypothetical protein ACHAQD_011148 [Fusarium lateritium]